VGCWMLNEGGGQLAFDSVGINNIPGALTNGAAFQSKQIGNCVNFDGTNDYISCGDGQYTGAFFTASAWIYKTDSSQGGVVARTELLSSANYYIRVGGNSGFFNTVPTVQEMFTINPTLNTWAHIALTYDGVTLIYYINGVVSSSAAKTGVPQNSVGMAIGRPGTFDGQYFSGEIQNVLVYNRALSATEVKQLYINPYSMFQGGISMFGEIPIVARGSMWMKRMIPSLMVAGR